MYKDALTKSGLNDCVIYTLVIENNKKETRSGKEKQYDLIYHIL